MDLGETTREWRRRGKTLRQKDRILTELWRVQYHQRSKAAAQLNLSGKRTEVYGRNEAFIFAVYLCFVVSEHGYGLFWRYA